MIKPIEQLKNFLKDTFYDDFWGGGFPLILTVLLVSAIGWMVFRPGSAWTSTGIVNGRDPDTVLLEKIHDENHTPFDTLGLHASPSFPTTAADADTMTPYVLTGGNDAWGAWVNLVGSGDMPVGTGKNTFDVHDLLISSVSAAAMGSVQVGWDSTTSTVIIANEAYSHVMFHPEGIGANVGVGHIDINTPDLDAGTLVFARCWIDGENAATVSMFIEIHEFDE